MIADLTRCLAKGRVVWVCVKRPAAGGVIVCNCNVWIQDDILKLIFIRNRNIL